MSKLFITEHAQDRLRQRFGLDSLKAMYSWVSAKKLDGKFVRKQPDGRKVYAWGDVELFFSPNESTLISVVDTGLTKRLVAQFGSSLAKEARKLLIVKEREYRKIEISVAEITLNMLKARNPKIKTKLNDKLTIVNDRKENLLSEIKSIRLAAKEYGVEV